MNQVVPWQQQYDQPVSGAQGEEGMRRERILEQIFPDTSASPDALEEKDDASSSSSSASKAILTYDVELQRYVSQPNADLLASPACTICLEDFGEYLVSINLAQQLQIVILTRRNIDIDSKSSIVMAGCSHTYHRSCILSWLKEHSDCPNCRTQMWDPSEFDRLMQNLEEPGT